MFAILYDLPHHERIVLLWKYCLVEFSSQRYIHTIKITQGVD